MKIALMARRQIVLAVTFLSIVLTLTLIFQNCSNKSSSNDSGSSVSASGYDPNLPPCSILETTGFSTDQSCNCSSQSLSEASSRSVVGKFLYNMQESDFCAAAIHAGVVRDTKKATINLYVGTSCQYFYGSVRNGITSTSSTTASPAASFYFRPGDNVCSASSVSPPSDGDVTCPSGIMTWTGSDGANCSANIQGRTATNNFISTAIIDSDDSNETAVGSAYFKCQRNGTTGSTGNWLLITNDPAYASACAFVAPAPECNPTYDNHSFADATQLVGTNLCSKGVPVDTQVTITTSGWSWSCEGLGASSSTPVQCSATRTNEPTPTPTVTATAIPTVTVNPTPATVPAVPVVNAATGITTTGFTARWAAVTGATGYKLTVATNSTFTTFVTGFNNLNVGNVLTKALTGLTANTTYYYRVVAFNTLGTGSNSNTITVVTVAPTATTTPRPTATATPTATPRPTATATPTTTPRPTATPRPTTTPIALAAPVARAATSITTTGFTANWAAVTGATGYKIAVSTSNTFTTFVTGFNNVSIGNVLTKAVTGLTANTTYYYRVVAYNLAGASSFSNTITAITAKPTTATTFTVTIAKKGRGAGQVSGSVSAGGGSQILTTNYPLRPTSADSTIVDNSQTFVVNSGAIINFTARVATDHVSRFFGYTDAVGVTNNVHCPVFNPATPVNTCSLSITQNISLVVNFARTDDFDFSVLGGALSGRLQSMSGTVRLRFATADVGKWAGVYAAGVPAGGASPLWHTNTGSNPLFDPAKLANEVYAFAARHFITQPNPNPMAVTTNSLIRITDQLAANPSDFLVIRNADFRVFAGLSYYLGYGLSSSATPSSWASILADLLNFPDAANDGTRVPGRFDLVQTLPTIPARDYNVLNANNQAYSSTTPTCSRLSTCTFPIKVRIPNADLLAKGYLFACARLAINTEEYEDYCLSSGHDGSLPDHWVQATNITLRTSSGSRMAKDYNSNTASGRANYLGDADYYYSADSPNADQVWNLSVSGLASKSTRAYIAGSLNVIYGVGTNAGEAWANAHDAFTGSTAGVMPGKGGVKTIALPAAR